MIRPYRPGDYDALVAITQRAFDGVSIDQNIEGLYGVIGGVGWAQRKASHVEADVATYPSGILVYEVEGAAVGYISTRVNRRTCIGWIPNVAVDPAHQGRGIGTELLRAGIESLRRQGMHYVRIETLDQNPRCCELYPRLGFREVARQIHYILPLVEAAPGGPAAPDE